MSENESRHFRRRRPPWWPPDEPFPPAGGWGSRHGRPPRSFFLRIAILLLILFSLAFGFFTFLFWAVVAPLIGITLPPGSPRFGPPWPFLFVPSLIILFFALRGLRRIAIPMSDLIQAAGRVAEGDYSARVMERGPREVFTVARAFNSMAARLQAQDEQRRNLLADVTHELRTPLTVVQGNLEGLVDGIYPLDRAHLEPILEETRVMSRLIEDLRTLALAESGALKLQKEPTDLTMLLGETIASFRGQAEAAGVELQSDLASNLPPVQVDPARIREVLSNVLANALRYTSKGGSIRVQCFVEGNGPRHGTVAVSDTGAGIPPEDLPHIFDRFYKSRESRGTGLGLAIARNLIAAHGGEIKAESQVGKGTTIRFTIPMG